MNQRRSSTAIFHLLLMVLGVAISLSIAILLVLIQSEPLIAQQLKKKKAVPPPPPPTTRGFPGNRTVSASMSGNSCDLKLVALAPEFNQNTSDRISERSIWGQTTAERPTLWFFVPSTPASTLLEFSLQNQRGEDIYRSPIPTPQQPGIIGVQIPANKAPLQLNRDYHWNLKARVPCGSATINRVYVDGWIKRVNLPSAVNQRNTLAENGIWYDAVTSLAQQRSQKPNDVQLQQDWSELLESSNLNTIAIQPILKLKFRQ